MFDIARNDIDASRIINKKLKIKCGFLAFKLSSLVVSNILRFASIAVLVNLFIDNTYITIYIRLGQVLLYYIKNMVAWKYIVHIKLLEYMRVENRVPVRKNLLRRLIGENEVGFMPCMVMAVVFGSLWMSVYMHTRSLNLDSIMIKEKWISGLSSFWVLMLGIIGFLMLSLQIMNSINGDVNGVVVIFSIAVASIVWVVGILWARKFSNRYNEVLRQSGAPNKYLIDRWVWMIFGGFGPMFVIHLKTLSKTITAILLLIITSVHWGLYLFLLFI